MNHAYQMLHALIGEVHGKPALRIRPGMRDLVHSPCQGKEHNFVARGGLLGGAIRGRSTDLRSEDTGGKAQTRTCEFNLIPEVQN